MNHRLYPILFGVLIVMFLNCIPVSSLASPPVVRRLSNGLTVLIQEDDRFPLVSERLYVHAGSAYEDDGEAGVSHLLEHMVFKGTQKRAPGEVAGDVEAVGGSINAGTSMDYTVYYMDLPKEHWKLGLDVLQDMIYGAKIDPAELESERQVVLSEIQRGEDDPKTLLFKRTQSLVWADSPYSRPVIGYPETVKSATAEDVRAYIRTHYQPQAMVLVIAGQVKAQEALDEAERVFGSLENDRALSPMALKPPLDFADGPRILVEKGAWNKVYLMAAFPVADLHSDQAVALEVLSQLLGGDRTSLLHRKYQYELQLVDSIRVNYLSMERTGMLAVSAVMDGDKVEDFWKLFIADLAWLSAESFDDRQIERAKLNLEDSLFRSKETISGLAAKLGYFQFFESNFKAEDDYIYALRHQGREHLQDVIGQYIQSNKLAVCLLAPEGSPITEEQLRSALQAWPCSGAKAEGVTTGAAGELETVDLGNGRKLLLIPDATLPYASVDLSFQGGDMLLDSTQQGLGTLTARVLTKGAAGMSATEIQDFLADRAAALGADSGILHFSVRARYPARFSAEVLGVFRNILLAPSFPEDEAAREKVNQTASIKAQEDRATGLLFRELFPFLYKEGPLGYYREGTPESLAGYGRPEIQAFWEKQRRKPFVMAVCGVYDRQEMIDLARELAGKIGTEPRVGFHDAAWTEKKSLDLHLADRQQAHLFLVFPGPAKGHPDSPGLKLLQNSLSGMGGPLFRRLRDEQGLGYTVSAMFWQTPLSGFIGLYIGTEPGQLQAAMDGFQKVVTELRAQPLPDDDLERGKRQLTSDYYREHQSLASRSYEAASQSVQGLPPDFEQKQIEAAQILTAEDVRELARKYLVWDKVRVVKLLP